MALGGCLLMRVGMLVLGLVALHQQSEMEQHCICMARRLPVNCGFNEVMVLTLAFLPDQPQAGQQLV
jgi:hypothetical protein